MAIAYGTAGQQMPGDRKTMTVRLDQPFPRRIKSTIGDVGIRGQIYVSVYRFMETTQASDSVEWHYHHHRHTTLREYRAGLRYKA